MTQERTADDLTAEVLPEHLRHGDDTRMGHPLALALTDMAAVEWDAPRVKYSVVMESACIDEYLLPLNGDSPFRTGRRWLMDGDLTAALLALGRGRVPDSPMRVSLLGCQPHTLVRLTRPLEELRNRAVLLPD